MKMYLDFTVLLFLFVSATVLTFVQFIVENFSFREKLKGLMTHVDAKIVHVAYQVKSWYYAMFSRWHIDSCSYSI